MVDKNSILQVFGGLMKHPQYLSQVDKYNLTPSDFSTLFERYIFAAIDNLHRDGAQKITAVDVDLFFDTNAAAKQVFHQNSGIEYLQDAEFLVEESNFDFYYKRLKKFNALRDLQRIGIDTSSIYCEDLTNPSASQINDDFNAMSVQDIFNILKKSVLKVEKDYGQGEVTETETAFSGMAELMDDIAEGSDIGLPIQGEIFNEVTSGARKGTLVIRSGSSGLGKTRQAVGDACYLAFPFRYDPQRQQWVKIGGKEKVLFVATEQNFKEIRRMIIAYITGINESKFRYNNFTDEEQKVVEQGLWIMEQYEQNFHIVRMPNPTIELIKTLVRENVLLREIEYVFYDYVFVGPALLNEFKGFGLRNDELLLLMATALKDLAVELEVFIMSSTQVNAKADENKDIRNEASLAGGRSTINKADIGVIVARPTTEEISILKDLHLAENLFPNMVTDVFKVRSGEYNQTRIWSYIDLGIMRKKDLFITDARFQPVECSKYMGCNIVYDEEEREEIEELFQTLVSL